MIDGCHNFNRASSHTLVSSGGELRFIRLHEVLHITGLSRATIWRLRRAGSFPQPHRISPGAIGWDSVAIQEWIRTTMGALVPENGGHDEQTAPSDECVHQRT